MAGGHYETHRELEDARKRRRDARENLFQELSSERSPCVPWFDRPSKVFRMLVPRATEARRKGGSGFDWLDSLTKAFTQ